MNCGNSIVFKNHEIQSHKFPTLSFYYGNKNSGNFIFPFPDTKVGFEQALYTQMEGETVMLCVTVDRILERSLLVNIQSAALKQEGTMDTPSNCLAPSIAQTSI